MKLKFQYFEKNWIKKYQIIDECADVDVKETINHCPNTYSFRESSTKYQGQHKFIGI